MDRDDAVAQVRERTDIVELIGTQVTLQRRGARWLGLCPFHNEKTPSFSVNAEMGLYYCFGCGAKGDIFSFMMATRGLGFAQALEMLADQAGVELPERQTGGYSSTQIARQVMEAAAQVYARSLQSSPASMPARQELRNRQIERDAATTWALGYGAPGVLNTVLSREQMKTAEQLGLITKYGRELMAGRLTLPVRDSAGRTVGLAGRALGKPDSDTAKYINTLASQLWARNQVLYGMDLAAPHIRKTGLAILVEGQFDTIQMHLRGWPCTVAPCGSAISRQHIAQLSALTKRLVVLGDGDQAGSKLAMQSWEHAIGTGMVVLAAPLPAGTDPDLLARQNPAAIQELIEKADSPITAYLRDLRNQITTSSSPEDQAALVRQGAQFISELPDPLIRARFAQNWAGEWSVQVPLGTGSPAAQFEWSLDRQALATALQPDQATAIQPWLLLDPTSRQALLLAQTHPGVPAAQLATADHETEETSPAATSLLAAVTCADPGDITPDPADIIWRLVVRAGRVALQTAAAQGDAQRASTLAKLLRAGRPAQPEIEQLIRPEGIPDPGLPATGKPDVPADSDVAAPIW
jgi:DNA primase